MVIFGTSIDIGLALLLIAVLAKYGGVKLDGRPLNFVSAGALAFILAGVLGGATLGFTLPPVVNTVLNVIGAIAVVIGTLLSAYSLVMSSK